MKRRYQIDQQRAVQEFRQLAREENPNIQMICSHGRGRGPSARRSRPPAARGGVGVDELGDGGGSAAPGGRTASAASESAGPPLGQRERLLRGGRAEGADPQNPSAQPGKSRAAAGQLRTVPAQRAAGTRGVGQDDARACRRATMERW